MSGSVSPASEHGPGRRSSRALALFFVLLAAAIALLYLLLPKEGRQPRADLRLEGWRRYVAALSAQDARDAELCAAFPLGKGEDEIAEALHRYNEAELRTAGDLRAPALMETRERLRLLLQRYARIHGVPRFHALGLVFRDRFVGALRALLTAVRARRERASLYLLNHPLATETADFRKWAGGYLEQALRSGLVGEDGTIPDAAERVPGLFFLVRWFYWLHPVTDYTFQLSDDELAAFWAWKVEQSLHLSLERRFQLVQQIERIRPDYPAGYVRGVLLAREDRWAAAYKEWQRWVLLHPEDAKARENFRFASGLIERARELPGGP